MKTRDLQPHRLSQVNIALSGRRRFWCTSSVSSKASGLVNFRLDWVYCAYSRLGYTLHGYKKYYLKILQSIRSMSMLFVACFLVTQGIIEQRMSSFPPDLKSVVERRKVKVLRFTLEKNFNISLFTKCPCPSHTRPQLTFLTHSKNKNEGDEKDFRPRVREDSPSYIRLSLSSFFSILLLSIFTLEKKTHY